MIEAEELCRSEATRRRVAFVSLESHALTLQVREPAAPLARALVERGWSAHAAGPFLLRLETTDWPSFWRKAGPLLDCGC